MHFFQKTGKTLSRLIKNLFVSSRDPFSISCFEDMKKEIQSLSPEEKERIKKKIEEM